MSVGPVFADVLPPHWKREVAQWLADDVPSLDIGGLVVGSKKTTATLYGKSAGVLAGVPFFDMVFAELGCQVEWLREEGDWLEGGGKVEVARVTGEARKILLGERTALCTLSRASGVATAAKACRLKAAGWHGEVAGTRKTTPGFRIVEKYALLVGGVSTHRLDLSHMVMLKDNHVWAAGSITKACETAKAAAGFASKIEVECRDLQEALEACAAKADVVMLDNYDPDAFKRDAQKIKAKFPNVLIEASGGITLDTLTDFLSEHTDIVSMGSLTQGYACLDFSLKLPKPNTMA
mmetsp:Transcript_10772/g.35703  ORF Transcript_10772/g.35703 Transcript_10772/m.35703 type:complete len:293 (+) Transcript_10772:19-897(+)